MMIFILLMICYCFATTTTKTAADNVIEVNNNIIKNHLQKLSSYNSYSRGELKLLLSLPTKIVKKKLAIISDKSSSSFLSKQQNRELFNNLSLQKQQKLWKFTGTTATSTTTTSSTDYVEHGKKEQHHQTERDLIISGEPAVKGSFPAFGVPEGGGCGCVLIYKDILATASHCFSTFTKGKRVFLGGTQLDGSDSVETVIVDSTLVHPQYNRFNLYNDIMLVKLQSPGAIQTTPVIWNTNDNIPNNEQNITAIGHGRTEPEGSASPVLLQVDVPIVNFGVCDGLWRNQTFLGISVAENIMICVSYPTRQGTCSGDSGGPLFVDNNVLVGITSFGHPQCSTITVPNVITRVSAFDEFIQQVICLLSETPPDGCNPFVITPRTDPCPKELEDVDACVLTAPPDCRSCIDNAFNTISANNAEPVTCISFERTICSAINPNDPNTCNCNPCRERLQNYYSCILLDATNNICDELDCLRIGPCDPLLQQVNTCLSDDATPATCRPCIEQAINTIFNTGLVSCDSFEDGICPAISYECDCDPCRDNLQEYYACSLKEASGGLCDSFDCSLSCAEQLDMVEQCLPTADFLCPFCIQESLNTIFSTGSLDCKDFEDGVCDAITSTCSCEPCTSQLDDYYACVLEDTTGGLCNDFNCCAGESNAANTCVNAIPGNNCFSCVQQALDTIFTSGAINCNNIETGVCDAITSTCQDCAPCQDDIGNFYRCSLAKATNRQCDNIRCGDPCLSELTAAETCLQPNPGNCGTCVANAFSALGAFPTCRQFEDAVCNAITTDCDCGECNDAIKAYYVCSLEESTGRVCDNSFDCSVPCSSELDVANICLDGLFTDGTTCENCVRSRYNGLSTPTCSTFASTICTAINTDCGTCGTCTDELESYYDCILAAETDNLCSLNCDACDSEPCGLFGLSLFCPFTACGFFGRLLGLCACSGSAFSWLTSLFT